MRIAFTGGGTGGHFYPIIAVAEAVNSVAAREHIVGVDLCYISDTPFDTDALLRNNLRYVEIRTGKIRTYASAKNVLDKFKTAFAVLKAIWKLFVLYPDVVFGKGGYASFPAVYAARLLRIPVVIHESDTVPGRVNRWIAPYAHAIGVSFPEATTYFTKMKIKEEKIAFTGLPIRQALINFVTENPDQSFGFDPAIPTILVLGGSQGSERINESVVDILPRLLEKYQVIHQSGKENHLWMKTRTDGILEKDPNRARYHLVPYFSEEELRRAAGAAELIISRAGSSIFEFAVWGVPSILIPLPIAREDHQRENAYSYARTGACIVIEEMNLKPELLFRTISDTFNTPEVMKKMREGTQTCAKKDAAEKIARLLLSIGLSHG